MANPETRIRIEPNPKWVRGMHGGRAVVDSTNIRLVWEHGYYPAWYIPLDDLNAKLRPNGKVVTSPDFGDGTRYDMVVDDQVIPDSAWRHLQCPAEELRGLVRMEWDALESWFEEETEVFVHPRSPETRIDALPSSRQVRVSIDGETVAESSGATLLFETRLRTRYYLPKNDVRMGLLTPTETVTACPYKGWANYWDVTVSGTTYQDLAWSYRATLPESAAIGGLVCFYNEKVDIEIDGKPERPPST